MNYSFFVNSAAWPPSPTEGWVMTIAMLHCLSVCQLEKMVPKRTLYMSCLPAEILENFLLLMENIAFKTKFNMCVNSLMSN